VTGNVKWVIDFFLDFRVFPKNATFQIQILNFDLKMEPFGGANFPLDYSWG
jgi:hypothetical protein